MRESKISNPHVVMVAILCLMSVAAQAHAAQANHSAKPAQVTKDRLVLMPLRVADEDKSLQGAMETALVQGLQQQYEVLSGEQVAQKAHEIFLKESHSTAKKECDETRCMQSIAEAFQAELIATANVTKRYGGYFLALSIQNIFDNKIVYSRSTPCENCNLFQVVDKLKELSGTLVQTPVSAADTDESAISGNANDPENALWGEVQKGNSDEDYGAYLAQYPKGKYAVLAKSRIRKLQEQAADKLAQQDRSAWDNASNNATEASYQNYLKTYPQGRYATLATARIAKLKQEGAQTPVGEPGAGAVFRGCLDCPEMVVIPAGSFDMGSDNGGRESPVHRVTIEKPFAMGKTEVTQRQWRAIMGNNPSKFQGCGDNCPVEQVSWDDAKEFVKKLSSKVGKQYRLPSEAEWEYAARAGSTTAYPWGKHASHEFANYGKDECCSGSAQGRDQWLNTSPAGSFPANAFGLYDMNGNVWEWVEDSSHESYIGAPADGKVWFGSGAKRVLRGGSWGLDPDFLTSSYRNVQEPDIRSSGNGFRVAKSLP